MSTVGVTVEPTLDGWWFGVRDADGEVRESRGERRIVRAGETLRYDGTPEVCRSGLHCSPNPLVALRAAPSRATVVHRVRLSGLIVAGTGLAQGKYASQARTVLWAADAERTLRLVAADYAERALLAERARGREPGPRSWAAVEATRAYARGEIDAARLAAAHAAAWAAAAWAADAAAAWAARRAAGAAAWAAAWAAEAAAAWEAEAAAAWEAERAWQAEHLEAALMRLRGAA